MTKRISGGSFTAAISGGVFVLTVIPEVPTVPVGVKTYDENLIDVAPLWLAEFGVDGVYQPGVLDRDILAIIRYITDDGQVTPMVRHRSPIVNVKVANDSTIGISADEFEQGQKISLPPRKLADARDFSLGRIVKQDAGMLTFEVH